MKIVDKITNNPCNNKGLTIKPQGLMIHSVGTPQPDPLVFVNTWKTSTEACAHAVLGADGNVYQVLPWIRRGWHAGSPANDIFISVELTEPSTIRYTSGAKFVDNNPVETKKHVQDTYSHAVEFAAYICQQFGFNPLDNNQLLSHREGNAKGLATAHADVEHLWSKFGFTMNGFRKDVKATMDGTKPGEWKSQDGLWWYRYSDGTYPADKWELINSKWYAFDANGWMRTGWFLDKWNTWYFLDAVNGDMKIGWYQVDSQWYYFDSNGAMMKQRWIEINGTYYYLKDSGAMLTGWLFENNKWYWLKENGAMASDEILYINNKQYRFTKDGHMVE